MEKYILFYKKYKEIIIPIVFLFAAVFIVIQISLPKFFEITGLHQKMADEEKKLKTYQNSYGVITSIDDSDLNTAFATATSALPAVKDPGAIYLAIVSAATNANVQLKGLSVTVGSIVKTDDPIVKNIPIQVLVTADFSGIDVPSFEKLLKTLMKEAPISLITQVGISKNDGILKIEFYSKAYDLKAINSENISNLTPAETEILKEITF